MIQEGSKGSARRRRTRTTVVIATTAIAAATIGYLTHLADESLQLTARLTARPTATHHSQAMSLTKQQRVILDAIAFFLAKGELPTVREVGALVGLRSPATVLKHLRALELAGWISITGKSRGIRLLRPIPDPESLQLPPATASTGAAVGPGKAAMPSHLLPQEKNPLATFQPTGSPEISKDGQNVVRGLFRPGILPFPLPASLPRIPLLGAIAAGKPFESYSDGFHAVPDGVSEDGLYSDASRSRRRDAGGFPPVGSTPQRRSEQGIAVDPRMFVESGDVFALQIEGDSMVNAGILDGDYVIIRRQNQVEEGEIAAVIINGEGTLKRWRTISLDKSRGKEGEPRKGVALVPANDRFDPIEITEDDAKDVLVLGKYVGLVRGNLRFME